MKRLVSFLLVLVLLVSALPLAGAFTDDASIDKSYKRAVTAMAEKKIIGGFTDGSFGPAQTLTRAQAAKILCVMLEGEEKANALTKTDTGFADVPASHWAAKFVAYCADKGIVAGVGDGKFDPDGKLSSAAFAKMLLVAYGEDGAKFTGADWMKNVNAAAEPTFLTYNLKEFSNAALPRQEACQLAFNAIFQAEAKADREKGDPRTMPVEVPESLKVFVIGNSFGNDCSIDYLYRMLKDVGIKDVTVGTLYYSGCPYEKHVKFALEDQAVYKYYKNNSGKMVTTTKITFDKALADEKWDRIMVLSGYAYRSIDFGPCPWQDLLLHYVQSTQPDAFYGYDMTWAFRADSTKQDYLKYHGGDQMKMYQAAVSETQKYVVPEQRFKFIVPVGTAIQNARTSFIGDHLDRDSYHLNKGIGRYIGTMAVCCTLTGVDPDKITYLPETLVQEKKDYSIEGLDLTKPGMLEALGKVARESVANALAKPYEITQSKFTAKP